MIRNFSIAIGVAFASSFATAADKQPSNSNAHYIKAEVRGKLVSIGDAKKNEHPLLEVGPVRWRLHFSKDKRIAAAIKSLGGKEIVVTGKLEIRDATSKTTPQSTGTRKLEYHLILETLKYEMPTTKSVTIRRTPPASPDYLETIAYFFKYMDKDSNRFLDSDEFSISRRILPAFKKAGIKTDGKMTKDEFFQNYLRVFPEKPRGDDAEKGRRRIR